MTWKKVHFPLTSDSREQTLWNDKMKPFGESLNRVVAEPFIYALTGWLAYMHIMTSTQKHYGPVFTVRFRTHSCRPCWARGRRYSPASPRPWRGPHVAPRRPATAAHWRYGAARDPVSQSQDPLRTVTRLPFRTSLFASAGWVSLCRSSWERRWTPRPVWTPQGPRSRPACTCCNYQERDQQGALHSDLIARLLACVCVCWVCIPDWMCWTMLKRAD